MGNAFKKAFEDFEVDPNMDLWKDISKKNIELGNVQKSYSIYKVVASVAVFTLMSMAAYLIYSTNSKSKDSNIVNEMPSTKIEVVENNTLTIDIDTPAETKEVEVVESEKFVEKQNEDIIENNRKEKTEKKITVNNNIPKTNSIVEVKVDDNPKIEDSIRMNVVKGNMLLSNIDNKPDIANNEIKVIDDTVEMDVIPFKVNFGSDKDVCFGEDAILEVEDGYSYLWSNGLISSKIVVSPTENSIYSVTVTNSKGQTQIHEYSVNIDRGCSALFIPSAFTPNFDGQNDVFKAEGNGILKMKMFVFDKFGTKVFEANSVDDEWDGSYRGKVLEEGVFFYKAEYTDGHGYAHVKNGQITLIK